MCNTADPIQANPLKHITCEGVNGCSCAPSKFHQRRWKWMIVITIRDLTTAGRKKKKQGQMNREAMRRWRWLKLLKGE